MKLPVGLLSPSRKAVLAGLVAAPNPAIEDVAAFFLCSDQPAASTSTAAYAIVT